MMKVMTFPKNFTWGVSTSAGQIEGAAQIDGRGPSIWDEFAKRSGSISDGTTPEVACDHYHRYAEDFDIMQRLGVGGYRMSISWSRVLPEGTGRVNEAGLEYYDRLIDGLLARNITPYVGLYHWDLPQALQAAGGWKDRSTVDAFGRYAEIMVRRLGDRVKRWITVNEPWTISYQAYLTGAHAPGERNLATSLQVSHNLLLAHGTAASIVHRLGGSGAKVGFAHSLECVVPASPSADDREAASRRDGAVNRWFLDPIFKGTYPEDMWSWYGDSVPAVAKDDLDVIAEPIDFLGIDYYSRLLIADDPSGDHLSARQVEDPAASASERDAWEINAGGLQESLLRLQQDYDPSEIVITGNGFASPDRPGPDGEVHDPQRIEFLSRHVAAVWKAIEAGARVGGYFIWSIIDNYEWNFGLSMRLGLTYIDFETQRRTPKDSARWYASVIRNQGIEVQQLTQ